MDLIRRTLHEVQADNCLGLAAQVAFFFVLALFPTLLFFIALLSVLPVQNAVTEVFSIAPYLLPGNVTTFLHQQFDQITGEHRLGLLTVGIIGAIWSSSAAMFAIIDALNRIYDVTEWRPWWKRQLVAMVLTVLLAIFVLLVLAFVSVGPALFDRIAFWLGAGSTATMAWQVLRWPMMVLFAVIGVNLLYYFAPNHHHRWVWITPGALLATALWLVASFGFKLYVLTQSEYIAAYGAIEGIIATMLWFYLCGLAILVGAELNAVVSRSRMQAG
jgi:membrane protein